MLRNPFRRLAGDQSGIAAVEFALIAPLMIMFYFGLVEVCSAYMAQKRMGHVTAMVADLVAQEETVNMAGLGDITEIGGLIMKPFSTTPLVLRVSSVTRGTDGIAKVDWSWGQGMTPRHTLEQVTLPADLIGNGESIIMSEAEYAYASPIAELLPSITTFKANYYLRPRMTSKTLCTNCPANPA